MAGARDYRNIARIRSNQAFTKKISQDVNPRFQLWIDLPPEICLIPSMHAFISYILIRILRY
jgi:hypothetical protein